MYCIPIAKTKKPIILDIATIPEAPNSLEITFALRNMIKDITHNTNTAAIMISLSLKLG